MDERSPGNVYESNPPPLPQAPVPVAAAPAGAAPVVAAPAVDDAERSFRRGAQWFYWIAGLSIVNTVIMLFDGTVSFVVGLGITQVIGAVGKIAAEELGRSAQYVAVAMEFLVTGVFFLFGYLAIKRHVWAYVLGMILYALDALIFLMVADWWSIGFHAFALIGLWSGLKSLLRLRNMERAMALAPAPVRWPQ